ncbi:MAG: 2TM domain-containing protein [Sandaracinaceae bacterium]|nr:2TM domain-containing protein [Sandaracinaceae bacterium]
MTRQYSDEEVEAIFRRALERQAGEADGYGHDELVAAAREVGLSDAQIERAVGELEEQRGETALRARVVRRQRERWVRHLATYVVVIGGVLGLHALGLIGPVAIWAAFVWGMGLALHTFSTLRGPSEQAYAKERKRQNRKERRAAAARAREEARRRIEEAARARKGTGDELERVIEEGVTLLLGMAAKKLREANQEMSRPPPPPTAFDEFVTAKKTGAAPSARRDPIVTPPKPRAPIEARVELDPEADELPAPTTGRSRQRGRES